MKSKKFWASALVMALIGSSMFFQSEVQAADSETADNYVLEQYEEITDIDTLIQRAKDGINEIETDGVANVSVYSIAPYSADAATVETYVTSQCIERRMVDGQELETYAINALSVYESSVAGPDQSYGNTVLKSTVYIYRVAMSSDIALRYSEAVITGTGSYRALVMENTVYEGWVTEKVHSASKPIANPTGINTLASPYTGYISGPPAYIAARNTLNFTDGKSISTTITVDK